MKALPANLIVTISIKPNERLIIFDKPLQQFFDAENTGDVLLTLPNLRNGENGRYSTGFTMDLVLYDREKAINCIRKALSLITPTTADLRLYNEQTKMLESVEL